MILKFNFIVKYIIKFINILYNYMKYTNKKQRNNQIKQKKRSKKKPHQKGGNEVSEELNKYYCDFMKLKSDTTDILHNNYIVRETCMQLTSALNNELFTKCNIIIDTIINHIENFTLVDLQESHHAKEPNEKLRIMLSIIQQKEINNTDQIFKNVLHFIQIFKQAKATVGQLRFKTDREDFYTYQQYVINYYHTVSDNFNTFVIQHNETQKNKIPNTIIKDVTQLFYRFYLKGGSAFAIILQLYQDKIQEQFIKQGMDADLLTSDEITQYLGKASDFDFNYVINPYLNKNAYYDIIVASTSFFYNGLISLVMEHEFFNNADFVKYFMKELKKNDPSILGKPMYEETGTMNIGYFKTKAFEILYNQNNPPIDALSMNTIKKYNLESVTNNIDKNYIGEVSVGFLDIPNPYQEQGLKNIQFILIRLMTILKNTIQNVRCIGVTHKGERFVKTPANIAGELIDISIPVYTSVERFTKWKEAQNTIYYSNSSNKNVYLYNLTAIIHDLEIVVAENRLVPDHPKLKKREKRLNFFYKLICILPSINNVINLVDKQTIEDSCKKILEDICNIPEIILTKNNKKSLQNILVGIYNTFPNLIHEPRLSIYDLTKQFFYYYLTYRYTIADANMLELTTPIKKRLPGENYLEIADLQYKHASHYKHAYYSVFSINDSKEIQKYLSIENGIIQYVYELLNRIEIQGKSNADYFKNVLCFFLVEVNNIIRSINDNTNIFTTINSYIYHLRLLKELLDKNIIIDSHEMKYYLLGELLQANKTKIYNQIENKNITTKTFVKQHHNALNGIILLLQSLTTHLQSNAMYSLRGGFLYNIFNVIRKNMNTQLPFTSDEIDTNDIDYRIDVNMKPDQFDSFVKDVIYLYLEHYLSEYFTRYKKNNQRILLLKQKRNTDFYMIQVIVQEFIKIEKANDHEYSTILHEIHPEINQSSTYRIYESHTFEINIHNGKPVPGLQFRKLLSYPFANVREIINKYNIDIHNKIREINIPAVLKSRFTAWNPSPEQIDFSSLYIQSSLDMKLQYQQIINSDDDVIQKIKYMKRLV